MRYETFEAIYLFYICNSKATKISPDQHSDFHRFLFTEDSLKIKKSLELATVSKPHCLYNFFDKKCCFVMLHKLTKFYYTTVFNSQVILQNVFHVSCLGIWRRHYIWISESLKFDNLKKEGKELSNWNKKHFSFSVLS